MYPTPPSLEANKHSPETAPPSDALVEAMVERLIVKTERLSPIKQRPTASIVDASKVCCFYGAVIPLSGAMFFLAVCSTEVFCRTV